MKTQNHIARIIAFAACLIAPAIPSQAAQVDAFWNPATATWNVAANWTPAVIPNNGTGGNTYNVKIDNGSATASQVTLNLSPTIDNLTVDTGDTLTIENGRTLSFASGAMAGTVNNAGTIVIGSIGSNTYFRPTSGPLTLTGGGVVEMTDRTTNWIYKAVAGGSLINNDNTIRGAGNIGWNGSPTAIENHGTILANVTNILDVEASAGAINTGTLRAASGGTLRLSGGTITNVGGLIEALDASVVQLNANAIIAGGTLSTTNTGIVSVLGSSSVLDGSTNIITNNGHIRITNGSHLDLRGTIHNTGIIDINSIGGNTYLQPNGPVILTGGGLVQMSNQTTNWIYKSSATGSLINVDNTIQGAGTISWNGSPTAITNQALIIANLPSALVVDASTGVTNTGTMRAESGGTLRLSGGGVFTNVGGLIEALAGSTVELNANATIAGGILSTTGTGLISVLGSSSVLDGSANTVTNNGHIRITNGSHLDLRGTVHNTGTIDINSTAGNTYLQPDGPVMLTGGGLIQMSDSTVNWIYKATASGSLTNVDNTIQGAGTIGWNGSPTPITNQGTIIASGTQSLKLDPSAGFINSGVLQVTGAGGMQIPTGAFTTSGNVTVDATRQLTRTGTYTQTAGITTVNGSLSATTGVSLQGGTLSGNGTASGGLVTSSGIIAPGDAIGQLSINNGLNLTATSIVAVEIGGLTPVTQHDRLAVLGSTHLDGVLKVTFVNGFDPQIGDSFVVMTYPNTPLNTLGKFINLDVPCNLLGRKLQVDMTNTQVIVRIVSGTSMFVDVNCDCGFNYQIDVGALMTALLDPAAYDAQFPGCPNADVNSDGQRNGKDVQAFVNALLN